MWNDTTWLIVCAALAGTAITIAAVGLLRSTRAAQRLAEWLFPTPATAAPAEAPAQRVPDVLLQREEPSTPWRALPGNRIELGTSGFWIQLDPRHPQGHYQVYSPEGGLMATGFDLTSLQAWAQRRAAEREQFRLQAGMTELMRRWITPHN